jgi:hypothetical protein
MQARWLGLCFLSIVHQKSGSGAVWHCGEIDAVPHHAWLICVAIDEEEFVPEILVNYSWKKWWALYLLVC